MNIGPADLHGIMAMMPAFATDDAASVDATDTVDVERLRSGVDRIIRDGVDVLATTGSFGEFHTLLDSEYETLVHETVEAVDRRIPVFIGTTALNSRESIRKARVARDAGADGLLVGVPFYFPSTIENAVHFYEELAELFPDLGIMIYHNPTLHHVALPVRTIAQLSRLPNIVAMKDSHRETRDFIALNRATGADLSVFVAAWQYHPYADYGAAGLWSYDCWMGPGPIVRLRDAVQEGQPDLASEITLDLYPPRDQPPPLNWRETAAKIAIGHAGYVQPGPLRPPFVVIPPEVDRAARDRSNRWLAACDRYRPAAGAGTPPEIGAALGSDGRSA